MMMKIGFIFMSLQILLAISEIQLTLHKVHMVHTVKSALFLKWQVGFENDMKITPTPSPRVTRILVP